HQVEIFAGAPGALSPLHSDIEKYRLLDRVRTPWGRGNFRPNAKRPSLRLLWKKRSLVLGALNFLRFGEQAASGRSLERVTTLLEDSYYDIIHCHFGQNGLRGQMLRELGAIRGKLVTSFYGQDLTEYQQKKGPHIYQRLFAQGEKFIVISD